MTADNVEFDFQKALKGIQEGKTFTGKDGVLDSLIKNGVVPTKLQAV